MPRAKQQGPTTPRVYRPHPTAIEFHESRAKVKAIYGPVGCGKSLVTGIEYVLLCTESPEPVRGVVFRETYKQLRDSTRVTLEHWFGSFANYHKGDDCMRFKIKGADGITRVHQLDFRHARRPEDAANILSTEYAFAHLEEPVPAFQTDTGVIGAGLPEGIFLHTLMRLRQPGVHRWQVCLSFNPPSRHHWIYRQFFRPSAAELAAKGWQLFRMDRQENVANLPPNYYEDLRKVLDDDLARRYLDGETVTLYPGRRVYREFYERHHFRDDLPWVTGIPLVIGFDFGGTPAALICQTMPSGQLRVYRQVQFLDARGNLEVTGIRQLCQKLKEVLASEFSGAKKWRCWGDPAGAQRSQNDAVTAFAIASQMGFDISPGEVTFAGRRDALKSRATKLIEGESAILIDRGGCPMVEEGLLGAYRYPEGTEGTIAPQPYKNKCSHLINCLEYIVTGEYELIEDRATGEASVWRESRAALDPFDTRRSRGRTGTWQGY